MIFFRSQAASQNAKHIVMSQMDNFESLEDKLAPATSRMTKEVLNGFLDCPMASQCHGFWKIYEKNANTKIKLALTKVAKKVPYTTPNIHRC